MTRERTRAREAERRERNKERDTHALRRLGACESFVVGGMRLAFGESTISHARASSADDALPAQAAEE